MPNASSAISSRGPSGVGLVGEDADHRVAGLVAVQHPGVAILAVHGDVVPDSDRDHGWFSVPAAHRRPGPRMAGWRTARVSAAVSHRDGRCSRPVTAALYRRWPSVLLP